MRRALVLCIAFSLSFAPSVPAAAPPAIFFSDITSGPAHGGENGEGSFVTLFGSGFGAARGDSFVTMGDRQVSGYPVWSDSRVTFQLGRSASSGFIRVHTASGVSNPLGFQVREGRIFFVSASSPADPGDGSFARPWRSPAGFYRAMRPGDICYIREGTYRGKYGNVSAHANVGFGQDAPDASSGKEIVWAAYPGERARFEAPGGGIDGCFEWKGPKNHYILSGLSLKGAGRGCVSVTGKYNRIIGTECEGTDEFSYALIFLGDNAFADILGNRLWGMRSRNKLSHPLYIGRRAKSIDVGWNSIYDNDVAQGPLILVNEDHAQSRNLRFRDILIHDNRIDGKGAGTVRGIGFADQAKGSYASVSNNTITDCGTAFYAVSGRVDFTGNTIARCSGPSAVHIYANHGYAPESIEISGNSFDVKPGCRYIDAGNGLNVRIGGNSYSGNGPGPD